MPEVTCLIEHPTSCASMPKVIEMVACPTFMSHLSNEFLSRSDHYVLYSRLSLLIYLFLSSFISTFIRYMFDVPIEVDNNVCRLSLMPEATSSIQHPTSCASMP